MKTRSKITALLLVILMLLLQLPLTALASEATAETANTLTPDTLENGAEDVSWSQVFTYNGSAYIDSVRISKGKLPDNVYLNSPSWTWFSISGVPTTMGTYSFTIEVKNKNGEILTKDYTLTIERDLPLEIVTDHLDRGYEGSEYTYDDVYLTYQRTENNKWELETADGQELPEDLTIDEDTGDISWKNPKAGKYNLKITVTRKEKTISKVLKLIIEPAGGCTHQKLTKTAGKTATCKENGTRDYWYCDDCEYYFYDEECENMIGEALGEIYTTAFHSDEDDDDLCDTCGKAMPFFKKITSENEITSCGMYLVVSKIDDKYYTFKIPEKNGEESIGATEIEPNIDGTFSYPKKNSGVMILETEFAAECGELNAGKPRYSFGTNINGVPYSVAGADSSYLLMMDAYSENKYGYRMSLLEDETSKIASVYSEYWGTDGTNGDVLSAFVGEKDGETKRFFSFRTKDSYEKIEFYDTLSTYPIELYKLTYTGTAGTQNYTLSDTQSIVAIDDKFTVINGVEGKTCSTVGGISEAVKTEYVKKVISEQTEITGDVSVTTFADINIKSEDGTVSTYGYTDFDSIVYTITPKIEIKEIGSEKSIVQKIDDEYFDGSEMTVSLCVGDMHPQQIIHHKNDGTKEYFYGESSEQTKNGAKSFGYDENYNQKGNFVTFTVDSFSDIEILDTASTTTAVKGNEFTVKGNKIYGCTVILALYKEDSDGNSQLVECQTTEYSGSEKTFTTTATDYTSAKVMVWDSFSSLKPVTEAEIVDLGENG